MLVEFLVVAALVALGLIGLVLLSLSGIEEGGTIVTLAHIVSAGFGALIALAYAARGLKPPPKH